MNFPHKASICLEFHEDANIVQQIYELKQTTCMKLCAPFSTLVDIMSVDTGHRWVIRNDQSVHDEG